MVCSVSSSGRAAKEGKQTLPCFTCLRKYQHSNFLAPESLTSVPAFFLFPAFSLTLCPQFWAGKDLFLWVEFKEKKWSCNMPESSGLRKKIRSCQLFFPPWASHPDLCVVSQHRAALVQRALSLCAVTVPHPPRRWHSWILFCWTKKSHGAVLSL